MASAFVDPVIEALSDRSAGLDPKRLAEMLHMSLGEVADLLGVHRTTLNRNAASPDVQARIGPIATIIARAGNMAGCQEKAILWFRHQPIAAFGHKRAVDIVAAGEGAALLAWFDALEDGAYA